MNVSTGEDIPPKSTDLAGWQQAVASQRIPLFSPESIVAAIQDLGPHTNKAVQSALANYLSDLTYKWLWTMVGRNHPNRGQDIIDRTHFSVFEAIARPRSADGKGLREAFYARLGFRLKDAISKENRERRVPDEATAQNKKRAKPSHPPATHEGEDVQLVNNTEHPDLIEDDEPSDGEADFSPSIPRDPTLMDGVHDQDEKIDVERFLEENIDDDRKRLAFRLHMDGIPAKSKKGKSIAKALGIDESTARDWINDLQEQLRPILENRRKTGDWT